MIKILVKEIGKAMGPEKGNTKYLYELYPGVLQNRRASMQGFRNLQVAYSSLAANAANETVPMEYSLGTVFIMLLQ